MASESRPLSLSDSWQPDAMPISECSSLGIVTLIVLSRKGPYGFPFRRPHSRFPIH